MRRNLARLSLVAILPVLILSSVSCINSGKKDDPYAYFIKKDEPSPITGWVIKAEVLNDIMADAINRKMRDE